MKIQKKHAVATTHFMLEYLSNGFWPLDDNEAKFIAKVVGFGKYHGIVVVDKEFRENLNKVGVGRLPAKRSCARLDVGEDEADFLLDMLSEFHRLYEPETDYDPLRRYLIKYVCKEDQ